MATDKGKEEEAPATPEGIEKAKAKIKAAGNKAAGGKVFELTYDSFGESLEPIYYWLLDFLREDLGYSVEKTADFFAAAEASSWFGEMGQRKTFLEKRASELLGTINMVIKSIINLIYDLREFDLRFKSYEDLKSKDPLMRKSGEQSLKTVWLTEVDMKKGAAAINIMVQNLNFISLRDSFMYAEIKWGKDREETKKLTVEAAKTIDVPDIVKRPLLGRIAEFVDWAYLSEKELRKRYEVEKAYLKSQVAAMQVYTSWARPYLIATQKLMPAEVKEFGGEYEKFGISPAELVTGFDVMHTYLEIFGIKKVDTYGHLPKITIFRDEDSIFSCIEVRFGYRLSQGGRDERGHYLAKGKVVVQFVPYVLNKKQIDDLKKLQDQEVLTFINDMTKETLLAMKADIDDYIGGKKAKPKEEEKKQMDLPIIKQIKWTAEQIEKIHGAFKKLGIKSPPKKQDWEILLLKATAAKKAAKDAAALYETYKKSHGMLTW